MSQGELHETPTVGEAKTTSPAPVVEIPERKLTPSQPAEGPTPETDAFYAELYDKRVPPDMIESASGKERDKMKILERQRDEARRELATFRASSAEPGA